MPHDSSHNLKQSARGRGGRPSAWRSFGLRWGVSLGILLWGLSATTRAQEEEENIGGDTVAAAASTSKQSNAKGPVPKLSQPSGLHIANWQGEDLRPGEITASQDPQFAPARQPYAEQGYAEPYPQHNPQHGATPPGVPCDCSSCRAGPLGLGLRGWFRDLLRLDQGPFQYQDRGAGPYESWSHRPYGVSFMAGWFVGDTLIPGELETSNSAVLELRAAYPVTDEFVIEGRLGWATPKANILQPALVPDNGEVDVYMGDITLQFAMANRYFYQTNRWQPYLTFGGGFAVFNFVNLSGAQISETAVVVPIGAGFRYRYNDAWAFRFEFRDNISPGGPLANMHNLTFTGGAEWRFGGSKPSYGMWEYR